MEGERFIRSIGLRNFLSFGVERQETVLEPLNVLIGPNGSGKSNFIEAIGVLQAAPGDLKKALEHNGGIRPWLWSGANDGVVAEVEATVGRTGLLHPSTYRLRFGGKGKYLNIIDETIECEGRPPRHRPADLARSKSLLSVSTPESASRGVKLLADAFRSVRIYREWGFGPRSPVRAPRKRDAAGTFLDEDASNLVNVLEQVDGSTREEILHLYQKIYEGADAFVLHTETAHDSVRLDVVEDATRSIRSARLSSGALRYLSLLAILCHPTPPPLVCIEEPEVGLHPDLMSTIAELLIKASQRCQLVVTTHSVGLVTALWECPEAVVVCERGIDGTTLRRLDRKRLENWLDGYSLGELWMSGELGGTRW